MGKFHLTSFRIHGRNTFGAVIDAGMVDLGGRLGGRYGSALDIVRAGEQGLIYARAASATRFADYRLEEVEFLRPILQPEKIVCVGINYPERAEEYKDAPREKPKYPNLFVRFPDSLVGHAQPLVKPEVSDKFDYEGEIVLVIGR
jgi:2-keto-4-pentenoate hydratase/2-oxohepta-3-ene-1,7-dioic acid hydratase in catechol pathway